MDRWVGGWGDKQVQLLLLNHFSRVQLCATPRLLCPWDSLGKNTGVCCHFLLQCMKVKCMKLLSRVQLCKTPWTVAYQAPLSMGFSRQEYWSGLPCPSSGQTGERMDKHKYTWETLQVWCQITTIKQILR